MTREKKWKRGRDERSLLLRLSDRFGMDGRKSAADRASELDYRARRLAEMQGEFRRLVAAEGGMEAKIRQIHAILNRGKKYRNVHRIMKLFYARGYQAGNYRQTRQRGADYVAPRAADLSALMQAFGARLDRLVAEPLDDLQARLVCGWTLVMMIRIHPFADGNGRTTRTLMNLVLAHCGHPIVHFPSDSDIYKCSPVWDAFKAHMRGVRKELGWSLWDGNIPPAGYFSALRRSLVEESARASVSYLAARQDIVAIAEAIARVREEGFAEWRD